MAENFALAAPIVKRRERLTIDRIDMYFAQQHILILLTDNNGEAVEARYDGGPAVALQRRILTANNSVRSLHRFVLEELAQDGKIPPGQVEGAPDTPPGPPGPPNPPGPPA